MTSHFASPKQPPGDLSDRQKPCTLHIGLHLENSCATLTHRRVVFLALQITEQIYASQYGFGLIHEVTVMDRVGPKLREFQKKYGILICLIHGANLYSLAIDYLPHLSVAKENWTRYCICQTNEKRRQMKTVFRAEDN